MDNGQLDYPIGVQSIVIDQLDRLWILDTGRVLTPDNVLLSASHVGPKLVGVNLTTNGVFKTIVFPSTVASGDSYLNDVLDLRAGFFNSSSEGFAYVADNGASGRNDIIIVDLGSGQSWRHLGLTRAARGESQLLPFISVQPGYYTDAGMPFPSFSTGADGITLSADGEKLYWCPLGACIVPRRHVSARRAGSVSSSLSSPW
ncbi:hypothetical protein AAE478_010414 [Parahypoxylon ruwenzoriense]